MRTATGWGWKFIDRLELRYQIQEAYVRQVLETLHDLDNVLYEVVNEATPSRFPGNTSSFVLSNGMRRERGFMAHPVGMTFFQLGEFGAATIAPCSKARPTGSRPAGTPNMRGNPRRPTDVTVQVLDTDHIHGIGGDQDYVWESFMRGYNPIYMDPFDVVHGVDHREPVLNEPQHERARVAMEQARRWARSARPEACDSAERTGLDRLLPC